MMVPYDAPRRDTWPSRLVLLQVYAHELSPLKQLGLVLFVSGVRGGRQIQSFVLSVPDWRQVLQTS
jgi:hypothetical protein